MQLWSWKKENLLSATHSIRTAGAATVSICVARLIGMPEAYWAAIATLVVMQSTLGATLTTSVERIVASALGASLGAIESTYFGSNLIVFAIAIFLLGTLSFVLRLEKTGYRYASVTLTIIVLIPRVGAPWSIAAHRFVEVSIGIVVALVVVAIWEERQRPTITLMLSNATPRKGYRECILRQHPKMLRTRPGNIARPLGPFGYEND